MAHIYNDHMFFLRSSHIICTYITCDCSIVETLVWSMSRGLRRVGRSTFEWHLWTHTLVHRGSTPFCIGGCLLTATHVKQKPHCLPICSRPVTCSLLPFTSSIPFFFFISHPFLLYFRLCFSLSSHPPSRPCQPSFSCRFRCLTVLLVRPSLRSSLPPRSPPSFHFGFSDSGNEMFHYLHFTAFNRERI